LDGRCIVSLIGTLEQFALSSVLERLEAHEKSGLLVVKHEAQWVELYFHRGQLMCIGPVRTTATLGERLLSAGIISQQALQETLATLSSEQQQSEAYVARTLIDLKLVGREELRAWAIERASEVIQPLLLWSRGEIYFEEDVALPADRLLVAITVTSLLPARSSRAAFPATPVETAGVQPVSLTGTLVSSNGPYRADIARVPTLYESEQFLSENVPAVPVTPLLHSTDSFLAAVKAAGSAKVPVLSPSVTPASPIPIEDKQVTATAVRNVQEAPSMPDPFPSLVDSSISSTASAALAKLFDQPEVLPVTQPAQRRPLLSAAYARINASLMSPEMVLEIADLSVLLAQNPDMQITPEEWRLLTCADGQTTLGKACQDLFMPPEQVCQLAGELQMLGLVYVSQPMMLTAPEGVARVQNPPPMPDAIIPMTPPLAGPQPSADVLSPFPAGREQSSGQLAVPFGNYVPLLGTN
jgi:hypothetical protein